MIASIRFPDEARRRERGRPTTSARQRSRSRGGPIPSGVAAAIWSGRRVSSRTARGCSTGSCATAAATRPRRSSGPCCSCCTRCRSGGSSPARPLRPGTGQAGRGRVPVGRPRRHLADVGPGQRGDPVAVGEARQRRLRHPWGPALTAPFTEETSKYAGLIILVLLARLHPLGLRRHDPGRLRRPRVPGLRERPVHRRRHRGQLRGQRGRRTASSSSSGHHRTLVARALHRVAGAGLGYLSARRAAARPRLAVAGRASRGHGRPRLPRRRRRGLDRSPSSSRSSPGRSGSSSPGASPTGASAAGSASCSRTRSAPARFGRRSSRCSRGAARTARRTSRRSGASGSCAGRHAGHVLDAEIELAAHLAATDDPFSPDVRAARAEVARVRALPGA